MRALIMFLLVGSVGCVGFEPVPTDSGTSGTTEITTGSYGGMSYPSAVDLGQVVVGSDPATAEVTLTNDSEGNVKITEIGLDAGADFEAEYTSVPWVVGSGGIYVITITFDPSSTGVQTGALSFGVEGEDGTASIPVSGEGVSEGGGDGGATDGGAADGGAGDGGGTTSGGLVFSMADIAFGYVPVGSSDSQPLTITNNTAFPVRIGSLRASNAVITTSGMTVPAVLPIGGGQTLQVIFSPMEARSYVESLLIETDAGNTAIPVTGTAEEACKVCMPIIDIDAGDSATEMNFSSRSGASDSQTIVVSNTGDQDLQLLSASMTNDARGGTFVVTWAGATTLAPAAATTLEVAYTCDSVCLDLPNDVVDWNILHILSNDPTTPDWAIELAGG